MNGVPEARAAAFVARCISCSSGSMSSSGFMNVIASVVPGASVALWHSVSIVASLVRYMETPRDATTAGFVGSRPLAALWAGVGELQADPVLDDVRRRVDFQMQRTPQGGANGGAVGSCSRLAHLAGACSFHSRPSGSRTVISLVPQWVSSQWSTT